MNDGWEVGDLALCICDRWKDPSRGDPEVSPIHVALAPRKGSIWTVEQVHLCWRDEEQRQLWFLGLAGQSSECLFDARYFQKIRPPELLELESAGAGEPVRVLEPVR